MLSLLTDEEAGQIVKAVANYFLYGLNPPKFNAKLRAIWISARDDADYSKNAYDKRCKANRDIAVAREEKKRQEREAKRAQEAMQK